MSLARPACASVEHPLQAYVAVMRNLLHAIYGMCTTQTGVRAGEVPCGHLTKERVSYEAPRERLQ